ncbi:hypothetical protein BOTBODRAFT_598755 [Botryobasidium botryosum FD-172 SS1]|uniref:Protein kinase domain-containing protein n=1 Tax=Botryobasidium botryosum (strain FD-172 SS1) TaxID=930990 RepID=A0A067MNK9_BOTB1|nr:hypothetical protein BOTBODRAFT_598755 [Botryobasidium botryosum FD-172 SS1]
MRTSPPAARNAYTALLFDLYSLFGMYPWEPPLFDYEVVRTSTEPFAMEGFGTCWRGVFLGKQEVIMKCSFASVRDVDARRRAFLEMKVWQDLRHPNVLPFIGLYIQGPKIYMTSPWMKEGDLIPYLRRNPHANRAAIILQIAYGLLYLHTRGVIHGDLKGANILVSDAGEPRLANFGLFHKDIQESGVVNSLAFQDGEYPRWQSPELLTARDPERTTASDMFAFGRVIIEVYTEEVPFANIHSHPTIMRMVMNGESPARPTDRKAIERGLDDHMWEIARDCSQREPYARLDIRAAISRLLTPPAPTPIPTPPPQPQPQRRPSAEPRRFFTLSNFSFPYRRRAASPS